jgi:hypothetical protein
MKTRVHNRKQAARHSADSNAVDGGLKKNAVAV